MDKVLTYLTSITRPAVTSISSASVGTVLSVSSYSRPMIEIVLQYSAWGVAIGAGVIAIINGCIKLKRDLKK
ncbi:MAG: hypothetical protein NTZ33_13890 [Bacteroidetes bacterium]|nr:hypothetical protein [Bacteroidota bacterium]